MSGGGGAADDAARRAEQEERARERRIRQGMNEINMIFGGTIDPRYATTAPAIPSGALGGLGDVIGQALLSQQPGRTGAKYEVEGLFGPEFYDKLYDAQIEYTTPQMQEQFTDAKDALVFALARGGNLNSSAAADRTSDLDRDRNRAVTQLDSQAQTAVNRTRQSVADERSALVAELQATADPAAVASAARARGEILSAPQPLELIGDLFQNSTAGLAQALSPRYDGYGVRTRGGPAQAKDRSRVVK